MDSTRPLNSSTLCPVCGYDLGFEPWRDGRPSHESCPSCGIEFGYHDVPEGAGLAGSRAEIYAAWRRDWVKKGMPWSGVGEPEPPGWHPDVQLKRILE